MAYETGPKKGGDNERPTEAPQAFSIHFNSIEEMNLAIAQRAKNIALNAERVIKVPGTEEVNFQAIKQAAKKIREMVELSLRGASQIDTEVDEPIKKEALTGMPENELLQVIEAQAAEILRVSKQKAGTFGVVREWRNCGQMALNILVVMDLIEEKRRTKEGK